jgi:hypothetical protein
MIDTCTTQTTAGGHLRPPLGTLIWRRHLESVRFVPSSHAYTGVSERTSHTRHLCFSFTQLQVPCWYVKQGPGVETLAMDGMVDAARPLPFTHTHKCAHCTSSQRPDCRDCGVEQKAPAPIRLQWAFPPGITSIVCLAANGCQAD